MNKHHTWLQTEISHWLSNQLIDARQAEQLRARYPVAQQTSWSRIIFSVIGATVFGLGVILFFAYNWAEMPKLLKLAVVFGSLILTHGVALFFSSRTKADRASANYSLSEGLHILGTMLFGAGIWLIAQIYHIDEHYPTAMLVWGGGALALAWVLPSIAQAIIAVILLSMWITTEVLNFQSYNYLGPVIILLGVVPLAWQQKSQVLLFLSMLAFMLQATLVALRYDEKFAFYLLFLVVSSVIAASTFLQNRDFPKGARIVFLSGVFTYLLMLFVLSFDVPVGGMHYLKEEFHSTHYLFSIPAVFTLLLWAVVFYRYRRDSVERGNSPSIEHVEYGFQAYEYGLVLLSTVLVCVIYFLVSPKTHYTGIFELAFNGIFIAHCVLLIAYGAREVRLRHMLCGCIMLGTILAIRFTDLFDNLLIRSILFLVLGASLFWLGNFYSNQKDRRDSASQARA